LNLVAKLVTGLLLGLGAAALAALLGLLPFVETVELKSYDRRVRLAADPASAHPDIAIVEIDEDSLRSLEPVVGRWPWPRLVHAQAIDYLAAAGARAIVYDVLFPDRDRRSGFPVGETTWNGQESDAALVESVSAAGTVVLACDVTSAGFVGQIGAEDASLPQSATPFRLDASIEARPVATPPFPELARAARALGHNLLVLDADGPVRATVPFVRLGSRYLPSLSYAAAMLAAAVEPRDVRIEGEGLRVGTTRVPLVEREIPPLGEEPGGTARRALVRFRGPAVLPDGRTTVYPTYSFYDVFYSQQQLLEGEAPLVAPATFRDKVVILGVTAAGLHDVFATPFDLGKMSGGQIHANVIDDVLSGTFIRPAARPAAASALLVCSMLVGIASVFLPAYAATAAAAAVAAGYAALAVHLFGDGLWLPLATPLAGVALAIFGGVGYQYFVEGREKRQVKRLFSRYVSKDVYDQLVANPGLAELGGRRRHMTVLFSDIRGFTSASEKGEPEAVVAQLNEYFGRMVEVVFANRGTVDKFVGDMVMALFGAPLEDEEHADHAVETAIAMVGELERLNASWEARGWPRLEIGIGISSGPMIAGNIGSPSIMSYTVIGDAVNLGARLESLNKDYGTRIIISEATRGLLERTYDLRSLGPVHVKGRSAPVEIHDVRAPAPGVVAAADQPEHVSGFQRGPS
jgi:adenylate cyclase